MSTFAIIFLFFNLLLLLVFLIKSKLLGMMSASIRVAFFFFMAISFTTVFLPSIYDSIADFTLKQVGVYDSIQEWDDQFLVNTISETTNEVIGGIQDLLGEEDSDDSEVLSDSFFEDNMYPVFLTVVALILRVAFGAVSLLGMIGSIYLSLATNTIKEARDLRISYRNLEERVLELESQLENR